MNRVVTTLPSDRYAYASQFEGEDLLYKGRGGSPWDTCVRATALLSVGWRSTRVASRTRPLPAGLVVA